MDDYAAWSSEQKPPFPWKPVLIAGGAVVLVIVGGIVVWKMRAPPPSLVAQRQAAQEQAASDCASSKDPAACRVAKLAQVAQASGDTAACASLPAAAHDDCVWGVAKAKGDTSICGDMNDTVLKAKCASGIIRQKAIDANDENICNQLEDAGERTACVELISPTTAANCEARGASASACAYLALLASIGPTSTAAVCDSLTNEGQKANCLEFISTEQSADSDKDGLTNGQEVLTYRTDPLKADTDGDGYADGVEVKGGFNPNGPGKLPTQSP